MRETRHTIPRPYELRPLPSFTTSRAGSFCALCVWSAPPSRGADPFHLIPASHGCGRTVRSDHRAAPRSGLRYEQSRKIEWRAYDAVPTRPGLYIRRSVPPRTWATPAAENVKSGGRRKRRALAVNERNSLESAGHRVPALRSKITMNAPGMPERDTDSTSERTDEKNRRRRRVQSENRL